MNLVANETTLSGTILALTGDPVALDVLMEMAVERGYGLCCRAAGPEAMRILAAELPRVLVIDMEAPGARDLLRAVRANAAWRDIPLLGLTASNNSMITVMVDAPVFFLPELTGLEQALVARLEDSPASGPARPAAPARPRPHLRRRRLRPTDHLQRRSPRAHREVNVRAALMQGAPRAARAHGPACPAARKSRRPRSGRAQATGS